MSKAEHTFNFWKALRSLFAPAKQSDRRFSEYDPAVLSFARLGLLAYYTNPL